MLDVVNETVTKVYLLFQKDDITVSSAITKLQNARGMLQGMANNRRPNLMKYERIIVHQENDGILFKEQTLRSPIEEAALEEQKNAILTSINNSLQERFENALEEEPFTACHVFDPKNWPDNDELPMYGQQEVAFLFEHFEPILTRAGVDLQSAGREWEELKLLVAIRLRAIYNGVHPLHTWKRVSSDDRARQEYTNILKIIHLTAVYLLSTDVCERGFSTMNRIKSDWRANLEVETLNDLMRVSITIGKKGMEAWQARDTVNRWWLSGQRARRPNMGPRRPRP
jgi:hypothetical protein